jgi:hypothetical protein
VGVLGWALDARAGASRFAQPIPRSAASDVETSHMSSRVPPWEANHSGCVCVGEEGGVRCCALLRIGRGESGVWHATENGPAGPRPHTPAAY